MFEWLRGLGQHAPRNLHKMSVAFGQMLDAGKQMFDTSSNALLGGTDLAVIRDDLFATDLRINAAEQQIRRELVVHVTVHGTHDLPACLTMMSVVKDAERIGDYAKNIFDLAELTPAGAREKEFDDLNGLKSAISRGLADTRRIFEAQSEDEARALARDLMSIEDRCDIRMADLVLHQREHACPVTYALTYRYFKRVASHAMNIITSVYLPLDKIDFFDEKPRPTGVRKPEAK